MIVKVELKKDDYYEGGWRFIDGVDNLESRHWMGNVDGKDIFERQILIFKNGVVNEKITLTKGEAVYLCNNEGKTIERIN